MGNLPNHAENEPWLYQINLTQASHIVVFSTANKFLDTNIRAEITVQSGSISPQLEQSNLGTYFTNDGTSDSNSISLKPYATNTGGFISEHSASSPVNGTSTYWNIITGQGGADTANVVLYQTDGSANGINIKNIVGNPDDSEPTSGYYLAFTGSGNSKITNTGWMTQNASLPTASKTRYFPITQATVNVNGTNTVTPTASVSGATDVVITSGTNNGISITATGGGTASASVSATTNTEGYAPPSTQLGSNTITSGATATTTTDTLYITQINVPRTKNFTVTTTSNTSGSNDTSTLTVTNNAYRKVTLTNAANGTATITNNGTTSSFTNAGTVTAITNNSNKTISTITNSGTITTLNNTGTVTVKSTSSTAGTVTINAYNNASTPALESKTIVSGGKWQCLPNAVNASGTYWGRVVVPAGTATAPSTGSGTGASVSTSSGKITLTKQISLTPTISTAGYISSGTAGNCTITLTANITTQSDLTYRNTTTGSEGTTITQTAQASWSTGYITSGTLGTVIFSNAPATGKNAESYVDISRTSAAPVLSASNGYLYINKGYIDDVRISLAKLIPDSYNNITDFVTSNKILSGYVAFDNDGNALTGSILTYQGEFEEITS